MSKLIGSKAFYRSVLAVAVPIMIQNGITNFVGLLDNIMVGRIGTEQMSGVAIVNQLMFVFNICVFGAVSGAGIFGAQFFGNKNHEGLRSTFRFKIIVCGLLSVIGILVFIGFGPQLITLYLHDTGGTGDIAAALQYGKEYLTVMLWGIIPFAAVQVYSSTLRETGETVVPMITGIVAVCINMVLNYVLIFGKFGAPAMGVSGAALATVISRFVELLATVAWTHRHKEKNIFIVGAYRSLAIPKSLTVKIIVKGMPLLVNEALWSLSQALMMQFYSTRGLSAIAALNISSTISNLFNVVFLSMGNAVAIMVGQLLGAGKMEEAKDTDTKLIAFSVMSCVVIGAVMAVIAPLFPAIYNTTQEVKDLAARLIVVSACCMPFYAFMHTAYFTLRSGGKTIITFLFDSAFAWAVTIPTAFCLTRFTGLPIVSLFLCCQLPELIKCAIGFVLVKKGVWIQNIVEES